MSNESEPVPAQRGPSSRPKAERRDGWTLKEAFIRLSDRKFSRDTITALTSLSMIPPAEGELRQKFLDYHDEVADQIEALESFEQTMQRSGAIAFGRPFRGPVDELTLRPEAATQKEIELLPILQLPPSSWRFGAIYNLAYSTLSCVHDGVTAVFDIRIVPPSHVPNLARLMVGLTLRDIFNRFLRSDAELALALEDAQAPYCECVDIQSWEFRPGSFIWPIALDPNVLIKQWVQKRVWAQCNGYGDFNDWEIQERIKVELPESIRRAARLLCDRFTRILKPFR